jgi:hypothetical protein
MKIGDIISGKKNKEFVKSENNEIDQLKIMREQMEKELREQMENEKDEEVIHNPFIPHQQQMQSEIEEEVIQQQPQTQQQRQQLPKGFEIYKMTVFLENGQKLPIRFVCKESELEPLMKEIDLSIEADKVVTIGDFKIVSNKILYIDLLGR